MSQSPKAQLQKFDQQFFEVAHELFRNARANAKHSVSRILDCSAAFMSTEAHKALRSFYDLYFSEKGPSRKQQQIADEVSRLVDQAQALVAGGHEHLVAALEEDHVLRQERLALAALQKQLEVLISVDDNFRSRLAPVLSGMQFEDAMSQRLDHIQQAWSLVLAAMSEEGGMSAEEVARQIAATLSSDAERELFYPLVLKEKAPAGVGERSVWLDLAS